MQTILRTEGVEDPYSMTASMAKGKTLDEEDYLSWIDNLDVAENVKRKLAVLRPEEYLGLSSELVEYALNEEIHNF